MQVLKQVSTVSKNHKLHLDITLPREFPEGIVDVVLVLSPQEKPKITTKAEELLQLSGSLKNSVHFGGDPLTIQKALRDEWQR